MYVTCLHMSTCNDAYMYVTCLHCEVNHPLGVGGKVLDVAALDQGSAKLATRAPPGEGNAAPPPKKK